MACRRGILFSQWACTSGCWKALRTIRLNRSRRGAAINILTVQDEPVAARLAVQKFIQSSDLPIHVYTNEGSSVVKSGNVISCIFQNFYLYPSINDPIRHTHPGSFPRTSKPPRFKTPSVHLPHRTSPTFLLNHAYLDILKLAGNSFNSSLRCSSRYSSFSIVIACMM